MKYIKLFESFKEKSKKQQRVNDILDKISDKGIDSLSDYEIKVLDNEGFEEELDVDMETLSKDIMSNINNGFFISVEVSNIDRFLNILERNGVNVIRNKQWPTQGRLYFALIEGRLLHDYKQPNHNTYTPSFT